MTETSDIDKDISDRLPRIGNSLDRLLNGELVDSKDKKVGWVIMALAFNQENARCFYTSNIDRDHVVALMKQQVSTLEALARESPTETKQ